MKIKNLVPFFLFFAATFLSASPDLTEEAHSITVGEYATFLNSVAKMGDMHELYANGMSGQIVRIPGDNQNSYLPVDHDELDPMFGLTSLDAIRYCNWLENGSLSESDNEAVEAAAISSTENGSYELQGDQVISTNPAATYYLVDADPNASTFEITTALQVNQSVNQSSSPLMMVTDEETTKTPATKTSDPRITVDLDNARSGAAAGGPSAQISRGTFVGAKEDDSSGCDEQSQTDSVTSTTKTPLHRRALTTKPATAAWEEALVKGVGAMAIATEGKKLPETIAVKTSPATKAFSKAATEDHSSSESEEDSVEEIRTQLASATLTDSDASPNSSDDEYGAKILMRKISRRVRTIPTKLYAINQDGTEEITEAEIKANPGKYYIANFRGDYLNYFSSNEERRATVKAAVDSIEAGTPLPYSSIAIKNIETKYPDDSKIIKQTFADLNTADKFKSPTCRFINTYKTPAKFKAAVEAISPEYGNPFISTSKDVKVGLKYADHPDEEAKLHPKYSDSKVPKHRLIGLTTVIVHEGNEYLERQKADIEKLRKDGLVGSLQKGFERDNQEILFDGVISSQNIAGYVPLAYPNLSKIQKGSLAQYTSADKALFGLEEPGRKWSLTKSHPKTLGITTKDEALYRSNRNFQWRLAEKYATDRNPDGELIWVDADGKFNRFRANQNLEGKKERVTRSLAPEFATATADPSDALSPKVTTKPQLKKAAEPATQPDLMSQKIISLQQDSATYLVNHQTAQAAKKESEAMSWYCAWRSASEAAKNLQKAKDDSGVADQWSEIAKQQESSIPFFQQAISAFQQNESIQGNNLHEIGRSLYHSGDKLGKAIEAEAAGNPVEAAKLKAESLRLKATAKTQQVEESARIIALQKVKEEAARVQAEETRQATEASAKAKAKAEADAKREAAAKQAQNEARIKADADAKKAAEAIAKANADVARAKAAQAELERQQQLRRQQVEIEQRRRQAAQAELERQQQLRLRQQQMEAEQRRQQQIELLYRQQAAQAELERQQQLRYQQAQLARQQESPRPQPAQRRPAGLRMTGNYSPAGKPYAECPTCGSEYTVNSDGRLRAHGCP